MNRFSLYLDALRRPFRKLVRMDFLQPDDSVAFSLDNNYKRGYMTRYDTRAFIQDGSLSVSLQNGRRRSASVMLANRDGAFDYAVNRIWFGNRIRLSMGMILPDGSEFYLPQGVFYVQDPSADITPNSRTVSYNLVDKWAYLDGSLFGTLDRSYRVEKGSNIFSAMGSLLRLSRSDLAVEAEEPSMCIDPTEPVFTSYYNGRVYKISDGTSASMTNVPYDIIVGAESGTIAQILLELSDVSACLIGYDMCGALRTEPSQQSIDDIDKAILWHFSPSQMPLCRIAESAKNSQVYNDVLIIGEGLEEKEVYGRASNFDPTSDTNINLIGRKTFREARANYWNPTQCVDLATWMLKRKTVLQKSITIESSQMFHLMENRLISVERIDKQGAPIEKHIIQSFTIPIGEGGTMSINATSVSDYPVISTESSQI